MSLTDQLQNQQNDQSNALESLVGEGKKYKTAEELARAYNHASMHINELRDDLDELKRDDNLLNQVLEEVRQPASEPVVSPTDNVSDTAANTMTPEQVANIAKQTVTQISESDKAAQNQQRAYAMLKQHYGTMEAVQEAVGAVSADASSKRLVDEMANTNPEMLFRTITGEQNTPRPPQSNTPGVNMSASPSPPTTQVSLAWSEAQRMRKSEDPKERRMYESHEYRARIEAAATEAASKGIDYFKT